MDNQVSEPLPGAERAVVPEEKLRGYLLNPEHADGTHKLRVFQSALGIGPDDWEFMRHQLQSGVTNATVESSRPSVDCTVYMVPMDVEGLNGAKKRVSTVWKVDDGGDSPSFVTAYLDKRAK